MNFKLDPAGKMYDYETVTSLLFLSELDAINLVNKVVSKYSSYIGEYPEKEVNFYVKELDFNLNQFIVYESDIGYIFNLDMLVFILSYYEKYDLITL